MLLLLTLLSLAGFDTASPSVVLALQALKTVRTPLFGGRRQPMLAVALAAVRVVMLIGSLLLNLDSLARWL
jgi:hypothetical protein